MHKADIGKPVALPFTLAIDTREQSPFTFAGILADARDGGGPLVVTTERTTITTGDYSIVGLLDSVAIERKSLSDLFSTIGQGRGRFVRELARLNALTLCAAIVVEADWRAVLFPTMPRHSQLTPKTVTRSVIAWQQQYRNVAWWFCCDRRHAEIVTLRVLERAWKNAARVQGEKATGTKELTAL